MKVDNSNRLWKEKDKIFYYEYSRMMQQRRSFIRFVLTTSILLVVLIFSSKLFGSPAKEQSNLYLESLSSVEKMKKYNEFIMTGDESLVRGDYKEASDQYRSALFIYPNDSLATIRLISASGLNCKVNFEDCNENLQLLEAYVAR